MCGAVNDLSTKRGVDDRNEVCVRERAAREMQEPVEVEQNDLLRVRAEPGHHGREQSVDRVRRAGAVGDESAVREHEGRVVCSCDAEVEGSHSVVELRGDLGRRRLPHVVLEISVEIARPRVVRPWVRDFVDLLVVQARRVLLHPLRLPRRAESAHVRRFSVRLEQSDVHNAALVVT